MEIVYSLTEEDILALTKYRSEHDPAIKNRVRRSRFAYMIGFALMALGLWAITSELILFIIFILLAIFSFIFFPQYYDWRLRQRVSQTYRNEKLRASLGARKLRIDPDGLEEESYLGEMKVKWEVIDGLAITPSSAIISIQQTPSMVIPKDRVTEGDYEAFVSAARAHIGHQF